MKTKKYIILLIIILTAVFTGCSFNSGKVQWEEKDQLVFGTTLSIGSLDPANGYSGWYLVRYGIGETLFRLDDDMEAVSWLADGYERTGENQWKIAIKDNITFQNGKKMTPQEVKKSLDRVIKLNKRAAITLKVTDIQAGEDYIILKTSEENPTLIRDLCDPFAAIIDVENENQDTSPIGTGPFIIREFNSKNTTTLIKNENYWDGEVKLASVKVMTVKDSDTLSMALQSGEIDIAQGLSYSMVNLFRGDESYKVDTVDTSRAIVLYFNQSNGILQDPSVRSAINMAINKEEYCKIILRGEATPATGAFPDDELETVKYDLEKAKEIIEASGYTAGDLKLQLVTYSQRRELTTTAECLQSDLKAIGVEASIEISDNIDELVSYGDFDLCLYSNITSSTGDPGVYISNAMATDGAANYGGYSNEKADELISIMNQEFDSDIRKALGDEIQQIVLNDNGYGFIGHMRMSFVMKNNVTGISPHPTDYYQFTANTDIGQVTNE